MPEEIIEQIKRLTKEAEESDPVNKLTFGMWDTSEPDGDHSENTLFVNGESAHMSDKSILQVHIHPETTISKVVDSLEYLLDCIRGSEFPDWDKSLSDAWFESESLEEGKPIEKREVTECTCTRCNYTWSPQRGVPPKVCPKCKSHKWNVEKPGD